MKTGRLNNIDGNSAYIKINNQLPNEEGNFVGIATTEDLGGYKIWVGTQTEYDAILIKDETTLYHIKE